MKQTLLHTIVSGVLLGLALALTISLKASAAIPCPPADQDFAVVSCSGNFALLHAERSPVGNLPEDDSSTNRIYRPRIATAGELTFEDFLIIEEEARRLLVKNRDFRQTISPYQCTQGPDEQCVNTPFDTLVRRFDYESGFTTVNPDSGISLQQHLDIANRELRRARDLFAYLAVYADEERFRNSLADCTNPETVTDQTDDRCSFANRMRESLREVAYLHMIFGQQGTAEALGLNFEGDVIGGEIFVKNEVKQLEMAVKQYRLAEEAVSEGMSIALGNGCFVSDFYTSTEWALVSRAVEGLERAQHHIAVRKSYLDEAGRIPAENTYRRAATVQYIQLASLAGLTTRPVTQRCLRGERPDGDVVAEMVANMLDTYQNARNLREGRNIFGFDIRFTPARPYLTLPGSTDIGLWNDAMTRARQAKEWQNDEVDASREFDRKKSELRRELQRVREVHDARLRELTGCSRNNFGSDDEFFGCVGSVAPMLLACDVTVSDQAQFNTCVSSISQGSLMRKIWEDLRTAFLEITRAEKSRDNVRERVENERERNKDVNIILKGNAREQAWNQYALAMMESLSVSVSVGLFGPSASASYNPLSPAIAEIRRDSTMRQAAAEADINSANSEAAIRNLWLDYAELEIDVDVAVQRFNAQISAFHMLFAETRDIAIEARRARAYVESSPENDPSYRLVRDSARLRLASQLDLAARIAYMAAKRAEYEYAARLSASNFRISDIYRARTADDIIKYLERLQSITNNLIVRDSEVQQEDFTISIALHVLGLTDENLGLTGTAARAERIRLFRDWVRRNTVTGGDGKPVLRFDFTTSIVDNGIFSNVIQQGYDRFWLHEMGGIGIPKAGNTGFTMNLLSEQRTGAALNYRRVAVTQSGVVHLRARSGCILDYRMIHPAALIGLEWPSGQSAESATTDFKAGVNDNIRGQTGPRFAEFTSAFLGRPVSATGWQIEIFTGAPEGGLGNMDLQQLTDIEFYMSTTRASRQPGNPNESECVRVDF